MTAPEQCRTCGNIPAPVRTEADMDATTCPRCAAYDPSGQFDDVPHTDSCPTVTGVYTANLTDLSNDLTCSGCPRIFQLGEPYTLTLDVLCVDCSSHKIGI